MKSNFLITIAVCACLTVQFAYGQQKSNSDALKQKATQLLNGLEEAISVIPKDNPLGLSVDSVKKSEDGYDVFINWSNKSIQGIHGALANKTYFFDPENFKNFFPMLDENGMKNLTFSVNSIDGTLIISVKLKPASEVMYVYFNGIKDPDPEYLHTVPLFFTIVLGDDPFVLEQTPRHAGTLFNESFKE